MTAELRIYRTFEWELDIPVSEVRFGGRNPMKLVATDTLQYRNFNGDWVPVQIVEGPRPEHPHEKKDREQMDRMAKGIRKSLANAFTLWNGRLPDNSPFPPKVVASTMVEVIFRNETSHKGVAQSFGWAHNVENPEAQIVKYRVLQ